MEAAGAEPAGVESPVNTNAEEVSKKSNTTADDHDPALLAGLAASDDEKTRLAAIFWETAWTKLAESGWSKVSSKIGVWSDITLPS